MYDGKKSIAFGIFYKAIQIVGEKMSSEGKSALDIWREALLTVTPQLEVRSRRVGGANLQVPQEVRPDRKVSLAMKNMINAARKRSGHSMSEKLATEIMAAYHKEGAAYRRMEELHRMADANKAFAHFRR